MSPTERLCLSEGYYCLRNSPHGGAGAAIHFRSGSVFGSAPDRGRLAVWCSALAATALAMLASAHASPVLEVRLRVEATNFFHLRALTTNAPPARSQALASHWTARCIIRHKDWLLETVLPNAVKTDFYDGTNILQTTKITRKAEVPDATRKLLPPAVLKGIDHEPSESDWIFLTISPGDAPLESVEVQLPWLAFCSGAYLRKPGRLISLPTAITRSRPGAFGFKDHTKTFPDDLGLPRTVDFLASAELFAKAVSHESLNRFGRSIVEIRRAVSPNSGLPEGFVKATYRVTTETNVGGWIIPTSFVYEEFQPMTDGAATIIVAVGLVDSIKESSGPTFTLSPTERYSVADYRFRHPRKVVDQIRYAITNGQVPLTSDPALRRLFEKRVAASPVDPVIKAHVGIYVVFTALVAGPVIAAAVARLRRKHKMNGG